MTKVLVDSDIIIDFLRTSGGSLPELFKAQRAGELDLFLSTVTVLEIFSGESSKTNLVNLNQLIEGFTVVPFNIDLAISAGEIKRDYKIVGLLGDLIIGVSALSINAKLATRNKRHYQGIPRLKFFPLN